MRLRLTRDGQFHPIHNFTHLLSPKRLIFGEIFKKFVPGGGGTSANFLSFSTFLNRFAVKQLKMIYNGKFCQKSGLDWLQMANFLSFCRIFYLFPQNEAQIDLEWPISPDSQFSHLLQPKHLIFGEISKIFVPGG